MMSRVVSLAVLALAIGAAATSPASGQDYPTKPIFAINVFTPGSSTEIVVRHFAERAASVSGATVLVDNKPGALGVVGANFVARSAPDGYTVLVVPASSVLAAGPHTMANVPFDPLTDLAPVTTLAKLPFVLSVSSSSSIKTVAELTKHLNDKQGKGFYPIANNTAHVATALYLKAANTNGVGVRYKDAPSMQPDLISGRLDFVFSDPVYAVNQSKPGGILRPLAVSSNTRMPAMPDVPTMEEAGVKGFGNFISWWAVFVPAKTPQPIIKKLEGWFNKTLEMDETKTFLSRIGADVLPGDSESLRKMLAQEHSDWANYVKLAGITKN